MLFVHKSDVDCIYISSYPAPRHISNGVPVSATVGPGNGYGPAMLASILGVRKHIVPRREVRCVGGGKGFEVEGRTGSEDDVISFLAVRIESGQQGAQVRLDGGRRGEGTAVGRVRERGVAGGDGLQDRRRYETVSTLSQGAAGNAEAITHGEERG